MDRAALDAALDQGIAVGGWCPEGRLAEDGPIDSRYPLRSLPHRDYAARTYRNVLDSDLTLILVDGPCVGGTALTQAYCEQAEQPFLLVEKDQQSLPEAVDRICEFAAKSLARCINVAGPRASESPSIYPWAYELMQAFLYRYDLR